MRTATVLANVVGPVQPFPLEYALPHCVDTVADNTYWVYDEYVRSVESVIIAPSDVIALKQCYIGGVRIVYEGGWVYQCLAVDRNLLKEDPYEPYEAYDRAMSVVGRR